MAKRADNAEALRVDVVAEEDRGVRPGGPVKLAQIAVDPGDDDRCTVLYALDEFGRVWMWMSSTRNKRWVMLESPEEPR